MRIVVTTGFREELAKLLPIAFVGVVLGVTSAFIVLDHPVEPLEAPLPVVDLAPLQTIAASDRATQRKLDATPLPAEVRAVGSAYLAWNAAAASGMNPRDPHRQEIASDIRAAMGTARARLGDEQRLFDALRELRAYHTQLFVDELARARAIKASTDELHRLAGALVPVLLQNGWLDESFALHVPEPIARARFKLHWTSIVFGLDDCEHAPAPTCYGLTTLPVEPTELRALLSYLMANPVLRGQDVTQAGDASRAIDRRRLVYLDRLAALDRFAGGGSAHPYLGDYPYELGRGVLLYRLGRYDVAEESLGRWAATHLSDTRARNWHLAALSKLRGE